MLEQMHRLALKAGPYRAVFIGLGLAFLLLTLVALFGDPQRTRELLQPGVIGTLWSGLLYAYTELFQTIPPPVLPHDGFVHKLVLKIRRGFYGLLSALVVFTTLVLISISVRLLFVV